MVNFSGDPDWKRLLEGGFAFQNAPFASHPLDAGRARKAVFSSIRAGISSDDFLTEADVYLRECVGFGPEIKDQIARVEEFLSQTKLVRKKKSAWLIYQTEASHHSPSEVLCIIDSRRGVDRVSQLVEQMYMAQNYSLVEKMHFSSRPRDNPYPAKASFTERHAIITCGHNPWLEARVVRNLKLNRSPNGVELLEWGGN